MVREPEMKGPSAIHLDLIAVCNARCVFCNYCSMTKPKGTMSDEVFEKALGEISDLGIPEVTPVLYGELFLLKNWYERLLDLESLGCVERLTIPTNGSLLTPEVIEKLGSLHKIHFVNVSLNAPGPRQHKAIMGLDNYDEICSSIALLQRHVENVRVTCVSDSSFLTEGDVRRFYKQWSPIGHVFPMYASLGHGKPILAPTDQPCLTPWVGTVITWEGNVLVCCQDHRREAGLGNIMEKPLREIWNGEELNEVREKIRTGRREELEVCRTCMMTNFVSVLDKEL